MSDSALIIVLAIAAVIVILLLFFQQRSYQKEKPREEPFLDCGCALRHATPIRPMRVESPERELRELVAAVLGVPASAVNDETRLEDLDYLALVVSATFERDIVLNRGETYGDLKEQVFPLVENA
jgi:hypothetical protein